MTKLSTERRPSRPRSRARYDTRRDEIVDVAAHLFAAHGYHATSIDDLCDATGLKRGGLYHYIGSKEELLFQIHERFIRPLLEEARAIEANGDGPVETVKALARALMRDIADYGDQVTVFLHEWKAIADAPRFESLRGARREFESVVQRALERGVEEGVFEIQDSRLALLAFLGMINYSYQWYRPDGAYSADGVAETFCEIFLRGVTTE